MIWHIARKEIQLNILGLKFGILTILCLVLVSTVTFTLAQNLKLDLDEYHANESAHSEAVRNESSIATLAAQGGVKIDRPVQPLSIFAGGVEGIVDRIYKITMYGITPMGGSSVTRNPSLSLVGSVDILFVFQVIVALAALIMVCDSVSGEKEKGTLKLMLSCGAPRSSVLLGKLLGNYVTFMIPFMLSWCMICIVLIISGFSYILSGFPINIVMMFVVSAVYLLVIISLGLLVSVFTRRTSASFLACIVAWVVFTVVIPKIAFQIGGIFAKPPSVASLQNEIRAIENEGNMKAFRISQEYFQKNPGKLPSRQWIEEKNNEILAEIAKRKRKVKDRFDRRLSRTIELGTLISRISPTSSYVLLMQRLSGTSWEDSRRFDSELTRYFGELSRYFVSRVSAMSANPQSYIRSIGKKLDLTGMPVFSFQPTSSTLFSERVVFDVSALLVFLILFFLAAYLLFIRYDVT